MPRRVCLGFTSITNTEHSMKTEHTQGPWRVDSQTQFGDYTIAAGQNVKACEFIAKTQSEANARLIAAAPELLEALYAALPCVEESEEFDKPHGPKLSVTIRALLAKAEGNV